MSDFAATDRPHLFIDGSWRDAHGGSVAVIDSATERVLGYAALAGQSDIDAAVLAARHALTGPWATYSPAERAEVLNAMASALKSHAAQTAELVSRENGMPIALSLGANGYSPAAIFRYYANFVAARPEGDLRVGKSGRRVPRCTPWSGQGRLYGFHRSRTRNRRGLWSAAKTLLRPVTLELGGKSKAILAESTAFRCGRPASDSATSTMSTSCARG